MWHGGALFDLNPVGAHVWQQIHDRPLEAIAREVSELYGIGTATVHDDLSAFVTQLRSAGLLDRKAGE